MPFDSDFRVDYACTESPHFNLPPVALDLTCLENHPNNSSQECAGPSPAHLQQTEAASAASSSGHQLGPGCCLAGDQAQDQEEGPTWRCPGMGNPLFVNNTDELTALLGGNRLYRRSSLLCFTKTWLSDRTPEVSVHMHGFTLLRTDRDVVIICKKVGGGVCVYVNDKWCHPRHVMVKERVCDSNVELLAVSSRPYYLPVSSLTLSFRWFTSLPLLTRS